jgi:tetraprenyl-beta-curcumene synthase
MGMSGESAAVLSTLYVYRQAILPVVAGELAAWERVAEGIPDPGLRAAALGALREKRSNVEATAVFAALAPRRHRRAAVHASIALQVAVDYLDLLGEKPTQDPLRDGLALHRALAVAVSPGEAPRDWYSERADTGDGGYLDRLVGSCQAGFAALPSWRAAQPAARRAAERCGAGQSRTHVSAGDGGGAHEEWSSSLPGAAGYRWWEVAAGASSSVAAHALIALAATPDATAAQAELVDAAYFPSIGALTVLLDDLLDRDVDAAAGEHNYLDYYESTEVAAERLQEIVTLARAAISPLPRPSRHAAILTGVLAFYLSSPDAEISRARLL